MSFIPFLFGYNRLCFPILDLLFITIFLWVGLPSCNASQDYSLKAQEEYETIDDSSNELNLDQFSSDLIDSLDKDSDFIYNVFISENIAAGIYEKVEIRKIETELEMHLKYNFSNKTVVLEGLFAEDLKSDISHEIFRTRLQEATFNISEGNYLVSIGAQHVVWGDGLLLRVADRINPLDQREFYISDYLESRVSQWLLRVRGATKEFSTDLVINPDVRYTQWAHPDSEFGMSLPSNYDEKRPESFKLSNTEYGFAVAKTSSTFKIGINAYRGWHHGLLEAGTDDPQIVHPELFSFGLVGSKTWRNSVFRMELVETDMSPKFPDENRAEGNIPEKEHAVLFGMDWYPMSSLSISLEGVYRKRDWPQEIDDEEIELIAILLQKDIWNDKIHLEFRTIADVKEFGFMILPRLTYDINDYISVQMELAIFDGEEKSTFGPYDDRDRIALTFNYSM